MDHGLMLGMMVGGVVLSAFPIALGVWLGRLALREFRASRRPPPATYSSPRRTNLPRWSR